MDKIVDHLLVFEGEGIVTDFPGNYTERETAQLEKEFSDSISVEQEELTDTQQQEATKQLMSSQAQKKKSLSNKEREEYQFLGEEIERLETRKEEINNEMSGGELDHKQIKAIGQELAQIAIKLEAYEEKWLELAERK